MHKNQIHRTYMNDPIFALATSLQTSALHLHRISGNGVFEALRPYLKLKNQKKFTLNQNHQYPFIKYLHIYNHDNELIDDVMLTFYKAPHSYTGEDLIEITCHGNPLISKNLQTFFRTIGLRDAKQGEFTQRAFLNGKLDLAQAEAIAELIHSETQAGIKLSRNQMMGALANEINTLKTQFIEILSYLEAHIDFAEDEVGSYDPLPLLMQLDAIIKRLIELKSTYQNGIKLKTGLKLVLCGRPNAGKSTLYNKLLNSDRAIVTEIAGTTRDILTERLQIDNRDFVLMDTAGLRDTKNKVESLGVTKSLNALNEADVICTVIDGLKVSQSIKTATEYVLPFINSKEVIFTISKSDLLTQPQIDKIIDTLKNIFSNAHCVAVSESDISNLSKKLIESYDKIISKTHALDTNEPILLTARSVDKVEKSITILQEARYLLETKDLPEKIASNLYVALKTLEEILGEFDIDSVYESIFSTFCIGK